MEAVTTMDNANIIVCFEPAIMDGFADGNSNLKSFCQVVDPYESAASISDSGTCFKPR